jgi:pyruvate dehydrogenase E2 component (dihydrolipoamide acetyltransferase)
MQEEGYIAKLLYPEGAKDVKLGQAIAIVVDNLEDVAKFKDFTLDSAPAQQTAPAQPAKTESTKAAAPQ